MKKNLFITLFIIFLSLLNAIEENFLKKKIYFSKEDTSTYNLTKIKKIDYQKSRRKFRPHHIGIIKIDFEKRELENPVLCIPQTRLLFDLYSNEKLLFKNYNDKFKELDLQSYKSKPDLVELEKIPETIYIKIINKSIPFSDIKHLQIGEKEKIYKHAKSLNFFRLIVDQIFFYQGLSLLIIGIPAIFIFFVFSEIRNNYAVLIFGLLSTISGFVHIKLSAFSSYLHPFTYLDYSIVFTGFAIIFILLFSFIKVFFQLKTKRFLIYVSAFLSGQILIHLFFRSRFYNQILNSFFNLILLAEVYHVVFTRKRFSKPGKWIISIGFTLFSLISILNLIFNLEKFHIIFTPFGLGINVIALSLFYLIIENYLKIRTEKKRYQNKLADLKRKNLEAELNSLKRQIDPHFLFNSLGTLISLIDYSKDTAKDFVEELSSVYRYILQIQKKNLITLSEELKFVESYLFLMKQRFHGNLNVKIEIKNNLSEKLIIPAALQILVENAVKHNILSNKHPLKLLITNDSENNIIVRNNLQIKEVRNSSKLGLENLRKRLAFYTKEKLLIEKDENFFQVTLPLISEIM